MRSKRWYQMTTAIMTVLAVIMLIPFTGQATSTEYIVTVYKTPT
jgi:hypothetical protein